MNKLTDAEIVKALELCKEKKCRCLECPIDQHSARCISILAENALDLINRQKAEIERLYSIQKPTGAGGYKIENGKVVFYSDMLNGYRHEYKDLEEIVKELNLYMHTDYKNIELISHYKHKAQTTKAEAIKDFADKLKCISHRFKTIDRIFVDCIPLDYIDNLVKEMVGDNDV